MEKMEVEEVIQIVLIAMIHVAYGVPMGSAQIILLT
jgi:hypothetical protein